MMVESAGGHTVLQYLRGRRAFNENQVVVRRGRGATGWGRAEVVGRGNLHDTDINASGQITSAWIDRTGVAVRFGRADGSWAPRMNFRSRGLDFERYGINGPHVELSDSGAAVVWWSVSTMPHHGLGAHSWVRVAYRSSGGRWRGPVTLARFERFYGHADAAIERRGDVLMTYRQGDRVVVRSRPAGNGWRAGRTLAQVNARRLSLEPQVVQSHNGDTAVVYWQTIHHIVAMRRDRGRWGQPRLLNDRSLHTSFLVEDDLVVDEAGRVTVAWAREDFALIAATWPRPAARTARDRIGPRPRGGLTSPSVFELEANRRGDAVIVWAKARRGPEVLRSVYRRAGQDWGAQERLAGPADQYYADAAVRRNGSVDVVWEQFVDATPPTTEWYTHRAAP